ncbi:kinesin-like protein [Leishmania infantum JPCM5]|uniref:Kinesin-like protein n=2 Tax=Leishmania infantum TaxID=5671 RepID=A4HSJ8_LEIIN|nr:kinesin-like protein [Leishmania infantum JPCM5]CAM65386.1 kinesin-like protein [Leishmania infantum JPCM5]|eukprot:XP_001463039.1 kinesin-like protein [Leishmania infantum JPCM5]
MYSGCTAARQTHLLSPTLPQSSRNGSVATDPPSTVFVSPRTSSMHRSPLASFEEAQEGDGERAPHNSLYASSTNRPRSSTFIHSVSAYLSTATGKRGASSAATTVRASLANGSSITGNSASKPRQSRHQPSLIIASGCSRGAVHTRPAACSKWISGPPATAAAAAAPPKGAAASPVASPTSPIPSSNAAAAPRKQPNRKKSVASPTVASKRLATYTATATTTRCGTLAPGVHEDSYTKLESPKGRMPESDLNDANEGVDWACVNVGLGDLVLESMQLARASAAAPQADSVASTSAGNAGQDKNAGGDSGSMALPPQGRTSPAPEDGIATGPAVMVADDDVANADMNILVAVRVRPRTSLITAKGAPSTSPLTDTAARRLFPASSASSHSAEQQPPCELRSSGGDWDDALSTQASTAGGGSLVEERQRTTNSTPSHSATVRVRRSASRRAILKAEKNDTGNSDSKGSASKEVCVSADARNGFIDCAVAVAANASGGASTPAANGAAAGQRIRTLRFRFDCILDDSVTQADIMACIGQRAVARVLRGYHSTVMCYGQTGSGKTYTIAGPHGGKLSRKALRWLASQPASAGAVECDDSNVDEEEQVRVASDVGLLPRILIQLFRGLEARHGADGRLQQASAAPTSSWQVTLSALELYNNNMRDLLPGELPKNEAATLGKKDVSRPSAATRLRHHGNSSSMSGRRDHRKATASAVTGGRGQLSASPSPCAAPKHTRVSQRVSSRCGNSATTRAPPTAAASTPRANSHAGASTAMGSAKTMPMKWTAPTTTKAAPQLQIRLGAPASSASQSSPPTKLKKARAVSPPPSSWASLRQPAHNAGSEAVYIEGLREHQVHDIHAALEAVWLALRQRQAGSTELNKSSSRSHVFFFVRVEQYERRSRDGEKPAWATRRSTLSLVDLAGSERVSHTGAHGLQLKEAQNINRSLSVLGNVMRLLSSASRSSLSKNLATTSASSAAALTGARADQHIPYRDSKLTHILQSSLGGNAITFLLCNVSPDSRDAQETMSTLRFAKLCKSVKSNARLNETTAGTEDAQAAAEAKICQLAVDASTAQNRLQQLATYTWWLEGHLGYFAAAMIHQQQQQQLRRRLSGTLTTSASIRAVTSSSRARDSSGGRGLVVPEETTAPKVISGERSAGAGNGGMQRCDSLESSGVENKEVADSGAVPEGCRRSPAPAGPTSPEWWHLSPRPSSPTAPADDDKDDGGGGAAEAEAYWRSASARALLSPAYPIAQRRMELQRKLIAAAAAAITIEDAAMLSMLYSTDAAVGEAEATARDRVIDGTNPLEVSSTASTASTRTRDGGSGVLVSKPTAIPVSMGVSSASEETRAPTRHLRSSPPEHAPALQPSPSMAAFSSVPLPSLTANQKQPRLECPMNAIDTTLAEERAARAATQARLVEVEQSNLLLRLRLAELHGRMRLEGGSTHFAEVHQVMNAEKATRRTVGKDYSWAPSSLATAPAPLPSPAEASASRVLWPPHYSRASHDASLKVFLARCGFAAMDSMAPADAAMLPRRLA